VAENVEKIHVGRAARMTFELKHQAHLTVPQREPFIGISWSIF
jgi:hypothetical protein